MSIYVHIITVLAIVGLVFCFWQIWRLSMSDPALHVAEHALRFGNPNQPPAKIKVVRVDCEAIGGYEDCPDDRPVAVFMRHGDCRLDLFEFIAAPPSWPPLR